MSEHDPNNYASIFSAAAALGASVWGGLVTHILHIRRHKKPFLWREAVLQLVVSGFSGVLATTLCWYAGAPDTLTGFMAGTAGFMGSRALEIYERKFTKIIG
ncbi:phage holin family protein [Vibrio fluvialis]|uniref:phage holin family protein n=1 Tax=Vibrio TaxID=662 RepID=UPI00192CD0EE|nr:MULTISPECIES: phage holin family protein [Vibrio]EKO3392603.1 phage holin family protein [Vibrio fluvialis]MBL4297833.1 phage holin family protein [Vibrio fluvialis]MCG6216259.1 phage holin family protein [Vibrio furnissii]